MGPLKSMKYGAIVKALYNFSKKHQNYGKFVFHNWIAPHRNFFLHKNILACCDSYLALCEKIVCKRTNALVFLIASVSLL
jgi:hypothetical protein